MKKTDKNNLVNGIFTKETSSFNGEEKGLVNYEIANAIVESMDDVDIHKLTQSEVRSMTEKVLLGLSQNINWYDQVKDIVIDTDEYQKALGEQSMSDEEFAEEESFYLDEYFEENEEDEEDVEDEEDGRLKGLA